MTDRQRTYCISEAPNYADRDAYVSDLILSSIWGDDEDDELPTERIDALCKIWDATHRSIRDIAADAGLSQRKLAERFCIPYRTMENWCSDVNKCALYIRLMMQQLLGLL